MVNICFSTLALFVSIFASASIPVSSVGGKDIVKGSDVKVEIQQKKGLVVVFLSSQCPCSNSHIKELTDLTREYPMFSFIGVHSNADEPIAQAREYFAQLDLSFPVIQDRELKLAEKFRAQKTPHAFLLNNEGEILYRGGVSNSRVAENADRKFLRDALYDVSHDAKVRTPEGRTLGCIISRASAD